MKKEFLKAFENLIKILAFCFLIFVLGAIFFIALGGWTFLCFAYSLGIEILILGGATIFYFFSVVNYVLWRNFIGGGKWKVTTIKNRK